MHKRLNSRFCNFGLFDVGWGRGVQCEIEGVLWRNWGLFKGSGLILVGLLGERGMGGFPEALFLRAESAKYQLPGRWLALTVKNMENSPPLPLNSMYCT